MPHEILHRQEGLEIRRNENNRFCVITLHYRADPSKRSEQWVEEAKAGMPSANFRKEYEIEWDAFDGQKVFPEINSNKKRIIVPDGTIEFPSDQVYWAGYDHGVRNPSAFIVFTKDRDDIIYAVWEMVEPCANLIDFVAKLKQCPYWSKIKYIAADPSFKQKRGYDADGVPVSPYEMFFNQGVRNIIWGNRDEQTWLLMMRTYWGNPDDIQFKIFESCQTLVKEFEGARYPTGNASNQDMNSKEKMLDVNNHTLDACKYWMLTQRKLVHREGFKYQSIINKYRH